MNSLTEKQTTVLTRKPKGETYHHGECSFRSHGRKWHFTSPAKDGRMYEVSLQFRGGLEVAQRIAPLIVKDAMKSGSLGSNRANIQRLIEAARN